MIDVRRMERVIVQQKDELFEDKRTINNHVDVRQTKRQFVKLGQSKLIASLFLVCFFFFFFFCGCVCASSLLFQQRNTALHINKQPNNPNFFHIFAHMQQTIDSRNQREERFRPVFHLPSWHSNRFDSTYRISKSGNKRI